MELRVPWVIRDHFPVAVAVRGQVGRVIVMSGLSENLRILHAIRPTDAVFSIVVGDYGRFTFEAMRRAAHVWALSLDRTVIVCNTNEQVALAQEVGFQAILCNHNAFIDEHLFAPRNLAKRYDAVCNARPDRRKRVPLAGLVQNLAIVRGPKIDGNDFENFEAIPHAYLNKHLLPPNAVADVIAASRVGLALSESEGACLASSEYLLCGLPVVSTESRGGRDLWYTPDNSIVCEPTREAVRDAVSIALARLATGELRGDVIRRHHIDEAQAHRARFGQAFRRALVQVEAQNVNPSAAGKYLRGVSVLPSYLPYDEVCGALSI